MIKIAITDDHQIVIDGLLNALADMDDIQITGTYSTGAALIKGIAEHRPDILLLDLQLPDKNGSELVPILLQQYPDLNILILSGIEASPYIKEMMQKGCKGYLLKSNASKSTIVTAIQSVARGEIYLEPMLKEQLLHEMLISKRKSDKLKPLITQREREVLDMIVKEMSNQEIAGALYIY